MDFIIMDLEWNNTYARKTKGFINEIIEIGAVKLDENLNFKDKFSCLVRPQISKKTARQRQRIDEHNKRRSPKR